MKTYHILWPERRTVGSGQIRVWYEDAVANREVDKEKRKLTVDEMAKALNDAGCITLQRQS